MKFSLKTMAAAVLMTVGAGMGHAADVEFSTVENPVWYQVKFNNGGNALADMGTGKNLKTAADNASSKAQQWQFIGDINSFQMRSNAGSYVGFASSRFNGADQGIDLSIRRSGDTYEIGRKDQDNAMNQWGGAGVGKEIGEYNAGDQGNKLKIYDLNGNVMSVSFPVPVGEYPTFSATMTDAPVWYFIQFCKGGATIGNAGVGESVLRSKAAKTDSQLWRLVGDKDNFQIVSKNGDYLTVDGTGEGCVKTSAEPYEAGFSLEPTPNDDYPKNWEIKATSTSDGKNYINQHGGTGIGGKLNVWLLGNGNNPLRFIPEEDMPFTEYQVIGSSDYRPEHNLMLWYTRPASSTGNAHPWMDLGLPIGNGQLGAMVLGNVLKEDISVNEKTLWTGTKDQKVAPYGCYQNFGSLFINSLDEEGLGWNEKAVRDYWRNLDLKTAVATVSYKNAEGTTFTRRYLTSNPDNVIAALLEADKAGAINVKFTEVPGMKANYVTSPVSYNADGTITYGGKFETISFSKTVKIVPLGGTMTADESGITVKGADKVFVYIAAGTDFDPYTPSYTSGTDTFADGVAATAEAAANKGWDAVLADHLSDYQNLFGRVELEIDGVENTKPTDELINYYQDTTGSNVNADDPAVRMLEMLYFHYGRYLVIGSSRGVALPSNLQGIWSGYNVAKPHTAGQIVPWNGDIHSNINVQMNYWPAEPTNLSELHLPYLEYIINMAVNQPQWQQYAKDSGQTKGWTCYTENNIFGGCGSFMHNYTISNAWYCSHLWQHYEFTLDKEFLAHAWPAIWSTTEFWMQRLKKNEADGTYEAPNEYSPEHGPSENATAHAQQLLVEHFGYTLKAMEILGGREALGISDTDYNEFILINDNLDNGLRTEKYTGNWGTDAISKGTKILREWKTSSYTAGQNGHRHMSHLMCMYPFSQVEPRTDLFDAAVNSMMLRGDGATGWSMGWKINLWARAEDGDHARKILRNALCNANSNGSGVYLNLFDSHSPFQIDGNFGACSGIAEMLLQSKNGRVNILPALPSAWPSGHMKGMKAAGDVTVDIDWADGHLTTAVLTANKGGKIAIRYEEIAHCRVDHNGLSVEPTVMLPNNYFVLDTKPGDVVTLTYEASYTNPKQEVEEEPDVAIETVEADAMSVSVSNRQVTVAGATQLEVIDLSGRIIAAAKGQTVTVPTDGVMIIRANGEETFKVTVGE